MAEEILTGLEGVEASQGYEPMKLADAPPPAEEPLTIEQATEQQAEQRPIVERAFLDMQMGEPRPDNETVSAEDAARNLSNIRQVEADAIERQLNEAVADEADQLRAGRPDGMTAEQFAAWRAEQLKAVQAAQQPAEFNFNEATGQNEQLQPESSEGVDPFVAQALQDPRVLGAVNQHIAGETQRMTAWAEQVAAGVAQHFQANADQAVAAILTQPEFAGLRADQLETALLITQRNNPERHAELVRQINAVKQVVAQKDQLQQAQQQHYQQQFHAWATAQDNAFERMHSNIPEQQMYDLKKEVVSMLKEYGMSDAELVQQYHTSPLLRSVAGQCVVMDAARYRRAQRGAVEKRSNPVPRVQQPGMSSDRPTRNEQAVWDAQQRLKADMTPVEAAAYVRARRAASR